jgi:hypothetical protein
MLKGDSHRLYLTLRRRFPTPPAGRLDELNHVRAIHEYYARLNPAERHLLLAWAKKEESGLGFIPAALSGVPLIGLIFAPFLQQSIKHVAPRAWILLWLASAAAFVAGIYIHHRQRAFSTLHVVLLEGLCTREGQLDPPPADKPIAF